MLTRKHKYYWTCPACGANLDHGEKCDCKEENDGSEVRNKENAGSVASQGR